MHSIDDRQPPTAQAARLYCVLARSGKGGFATLLVVGLLALAGCSYLESLGRSMPEPDTRIKLALTDNLIAVSPRDIERYTCVAGLLLHCERAGEYTFSCTCQLPPIDVGF